MKKLKDTDDKSLVTQLLDDEGLVITCLRFDLLGIPPELALALKNAFQACFAHTSALSQRTSFAAVRAFCAFLKANDLAHAAPLPKDVLQRLRSWLTPRRPATAQSILNRCVQLLSSLERSAPTLLSRGTRLTVERINAPTRKTRTTISEELVKTVLQRCHSDIEATEKRLEFGRRLWSRDTRTPAEQEISEVIHAVFRVGGGRIASQSIVHHAGENLSRRVKAIGGLRTIVRTLYLTPDDLLPYYVAMIIQTSGNPHSILNMRKNCIRPHPLRADLERVVWDKPRANREQFAEAPVSRAWSAASIVRRLLVSNANLTDNCRSRDKDKLFVSYCTTEGVAKVPSVSGMNILLHAFIQRHQLTEERFTFSSFRPAGAKAHHRAGSGMFGAKRRLNHQSLATTARYTPLGDRRDHHDVVIHRFQGLLVDATMPLDKRVHQAAQTSKHPSPADTVFGFRCDDPLSGIAPGSHKGATCLQFTRCATCPGAIIPLDNVEVVSRLLASWRALIDARERALKESWIERYELLYEATRRILAEEIVPAIPPAVLDKANARLDVGLIPRLE